MRLHRISRGEAIRQADQRTTASSSTYLTVSVTNKRPTEPQPGNYDPSVAVFIAEYLASKSRRANNADRARLNSAAHDFTVRTQKMYAGGKTTPWWGATAALADEMTYECDANLGAPSAVDCAQVEWSQLGPDDDTISIGAGVVKFLSSSEQHERQVRTDLKLTLDYRYMPSGHQRRYSYHTQLAANPHRNGHALQRLRLSSLLPRHRRQSLLWASTASQSPSSNQRTAGYWRSMRSGPVRST